MALRKLTLFGLVWIAGILTYQLTAQLEESMRITLAIAVVAVILWVTEWIPLFATSLVILFLEVIFLGSNAIGGDKKASFFFEPFFGPVITLFLGGFALSLAMSKYQLDARIADWIFSRSRGNPRRLTTILLLSSTFVSMWISNAATTVLFMTVVLPILKPYRERKFSKGILLSIPVGATIGGMATPMGTPPNAIAMDALQRQGIAMTSPLWFVLCVPICAMLLLFARWGLDILFAPDEGDMVEWRQADRQKWEGPSIGVLAIFLFTIVLWVTSPLHGISEGVVVLVPIILLFATQLLKPADLKELGWDTLLLVGGGMSLGVALQESGLAELLVHDVAAGSLPASVLVFAIGVLTLALSVFISDTVATSLAIPIIVGMGGLHATDPIMMALASSMGMILPVSSPANAIIFSSGQVRTWDMIKMGTLISASGILAMYLVSKLYWPWVLSLVS